MRWSTLDLVFATEELAANVVSCSTSGGHGSDHKAVDIKINIACPITPTEARRNWRNVDWDAFGTAIDKALQSADVKRLVSEVKDSADIDVMVNALMHTYQQAMEETVPSTQTTVFSKRWWTPELSKMHKDLRTLQNRASKYNSTPETRRCAVEARRKYHSAIRAQQRRHWREWLRDADEAAVWQANKYASQHAANIQPSTIPPLQSGDGQLAQSSTDKGDVLMKTFFPEPPPADVSDIPSCPDYPSGLECPDVTKQEVEEAIASLHPFKAPGPSAIPNVALQRTSGVLAPLLTSLTNHTLALGYFPSQWRVFTTTCISR
ncbi:hypothetical protein D9619_003869 [Psilocybe cf. subviscida]|uniref:Endonuclease/exonuclease/phosphatase domain-containing protein n=1 Tax=Psilocybe cf. subviscida TaxID=2480587 RepID=A0A8H5AW80_9AGAR|nr:hypothetical protein D9619_003869 [Psilocybe cf. subviscida]